MVMAKHCGNKRCGYVSANLSYQMLGLKLDMNRACLKYVNKIHKFLTSLFLFVLLIAVNPILLTLSRALARKPHRKRVLFTNKNTCDFRALSRKWEAASHR